MTDSGPRKIGVSIELKPHAYDPMANPELFEGVLARRCIAFLIDVVIISIPVLFAVIFIFILGVDHARARLGAVLAAVAGGRDIWAIVYYGLTFGSPASATIGMRVMDIEMRTWYGAPCYFVLGAVHAIAFWVTVSFLTPFVLLVGFLQPSPAAPARHAGRNHRHQQPGPRPGAAPDCRAALTAIITFDGNRLAGDPRGAGTLESAGWSSDQGRDAALPQHPAVLPHRPLAVPLSAGPGGAQGVHASGRRAGGRAQRPPHPWRLPPQPVDRLPAGLRDLPGLRVGAGGGRGLPADPQHAAHPGAQRRPDRRDAGGGADLRAIFGLPLLSRCAPSRRRHGRHDGARLRDDGRGQPRRDPPDRIPAARTRQRHQRPRRRRALGGGAHRRAQRRPLDGLLVLRVRTRRCARSAPS